MKTFTTDCQSYTTAWKWTTIHLQNSLQTNRNTGFTESKSYFMNLLTSTHRDPVDPSGKLSEGISKNKSLKNMNGLSKYFVLTLKKHLDKKASFSVNILKHWAEKWTGQMNHTFFTWLILHSSAWIQRDRYPNVLMEHSRRFCMVAIIRHCFVQALGHSGRHTHSSKGWRTESKKFQVFDISSPINHEGYTVRPK